MNIFELTHNLAEGYHRAANSPAKQAQVALGTLERLTLAGFQTVKEILIVWKSNATSAPATDERGNLMHKDAILAAFTNATADVSILENLGELEALEQVMRLFSSVASRDSDIADAVRLFETALTNRRETLRAPPADRSVRSIAHSRSGSSRRSQAAARPAPRRPSQAGRAGSVRTVPAPAAHAQTPPPSP